MAGKDKLDFTKAPALPFAPVQYDRPYQDALTNILRQYFNTLDTVNNSTLAVQGGRFFSFPCGSFFDTTSQFDGATTIPYAMRLNTTDVSNGVTVENRTAVFIGSIAATTLTVTAMISGRLYPGQLMTGTGVAADSYHYLQTSSTAAVVATHNFVSGGAIGQAKFILDSVDGVEERQFVSGTGVPANTRVVYVDTTTKEVTLNANFTVQAAGAYDFRPFGYEGTYLCSPSQTVASTTITSSSATMITVANSGVYNLQFSAQLANTSATEYDVDIWLKKNDVNLADTNTQITVPKKHGSTNGHVVAAWNFYVSLEAGDYVEIVWRTENSAVFIEYVAEQTAPIRPAIPSVIATVDFVSRL